jgi:hypothetical protein
MFFMWLGIPVTLATAVAGAAVAAMRFDRPR